MLLFTLEGQLGWLLFLLEKKKSLWLVVLPLEKILEGSGVWFVFFFFYNSVD